MQRLSDFLPRGSRTLTPEGKAAVADVHDLVAEWGAGRLPLAEVLKLCSPKQRNLAIRHTAPDDPRFAPLMRLLDEIVVGQATPTKHGVFERQDLADAQATIEREAGRETVVFPVRYDDGRAVYRSRAERGATKRPFSVTPPTSKEQQGDDLWEV